MTKENTECLYINHFYVSMSTVKVSTFYDLINSSILPEY